MKNYTFSILFSIPLITYSQETISVVYQEWEFKSFSENSLFISEEAGVWIDNVSVPEMTIHQADDPLKTDKVMIICPGGYPSR